MSKRKVLQMPIKAKWFKMILDRDKREEYREKDGVYSRRIQKAKEANEPFTHLELVNGYGKHRPWMIIELTHELFFTGVESWGAVRGEQYHVLVMGDIEETGNLELLK